MNERKWLKEMNQNQQQIYFEVYMCAMRDVSLRFSFLPFFIVSLFKISLLMFYVVCYFRNNNKLQFDFPPFRY